MTEDHERLSRKLQRISARRHAERGKEIEARRARVAAPSLEGRLRSAGQQRFADCVSTRMPVSEPPRRDHGGDSRPTRGLIVCGETGSGKTTQNAEECMELGRGAAAV